MIVTKTQQETFLAAARPLLQWLNENCHPHVTVIVSPDRAELLEGAFSTGPVTDYIQD